MEQLNRFPKRSSRLQLKFLARAFGKEARVSDCLRRIRSYATIFDDGQEASLYHIVDCFWSGWAQRTHERKPLYQCNSCHALVSDTPTPQCKVPGMHDAHFIRRYSRSKYGPRIYDVGSDGIRPQWVTDMQNASHRKAKDKAKGIKSSEEH